MRGQESPGGKAFSYIPITGLALSLMQILLMPRRADGRARILPRQ